MTVVDEGTPDQFPALLEAFLEAESIGDLKDAAVELIYFFAPDLRPQE